MRTVICVAHHDNVKRLENFIDRVGGLEPPDGGFGFVALADTDTDNLIRLRQCAAWHILKGRSNEDLVQVLHSDLKGKRYASVMFQKFQAVREWMCVTSPPHPSTGDDDAVVFFTDPDYVFNPHTISFAHHIMSHKNNVVFLSLLKGYGPSAVLETDRELIGGFSFTRWGSCMGGAMIVRWKTAEPMLDAFFRSNGVTAEDCGSGGMFDQVFWEFLYEHYSIDRPVYTSLDFSLMQHCNQISSFLVEKGPKGVRNHEYGLDFDPLVDPMMWVCAQDVLVKSNQEVDYGQN